MNGKPVAIGLDIGKYVFQAHGVDARGKVVVQRKLRRADMLGYFGKLKPCTIAIETCASSNHWARTLGSLGHKVKLINGRYVAPYVKSQKNDKTDAEAICEAMRRPNMRFVPHKTETQQSIVMLHRTRELLVHQRIRLMNAFRAHLAEFGRISRPGLVGLKNLLKHIEDREQRALPKHARQALELLADQIQSSSDAISRIEADLKCWHRGNKQSRRLATIPGVGPITASYFAAIVPDPRIFHGSRQLAAWVGLVPRQRSSGGKTSLGRITRRGDRYLRSLLFVGARNVLTNYRTGRTPVPKFAAAIVTRKPLKVAAIAVANKMARIAWAVMSKKEDFSWSYVGSASLV